MRPAGSAGVRRRLLRLSRPTRPCPLGETRIRPRYDLSLFAIRYWNVSLEVENDDVTNGGTGRPARLKALGSAWASFSPAHSDAPAAIEGPIFPSRSNFGANVGQSH